MEGQYVQIVVVAVLSVIAALFICLRLWAKSRRRTTGADDLLVIIGLLLTWVLGVQDILWVVKGYEGRHMKDLSEDQIGTFSKYFFANQVTYVIVPLPIKLSILISYWNIFGASRHFRFLTYIVGSMTIAWSFILLFVCIFQCHPVRAYWDRSSGHCSNLTDYAWGNAISNLAIDVIILCMPAVPLWRLQISSLQRKLAFGSFALGFFVCIASILRITTMERVSAADISDAIVSPATWTYIEPSAAIISACLPFLRPLISRKPMMASSYNNYHDRSAPRGTATVAFGNEEEASRGMKRRSSTSGLYPGRGAAAISGATSVSRHYARLSSPTQVSLELQSIDQETRKRGDDQPLDIGASQ